jgi:two-component system NarL family sensor kinase
MPSTARISSKGRPLRGQTRRGRTKAPTLPMLVAPGIETEALLRSTLDSLSAHVAVLDATGTIIAVNKAWRLFAQQSGYVGDDDGVGTNYLAVCEGGAAVSGDAAATATALRDILKGRRSEFRMEYPCIGPDGPRWFQLRITRPEPQEAPRIVIAHEDITEVKRVQEELTRLTAHLMQLQDEERRSIARELHDTTAQNLLAVTLNVTRLRERLRSASPPTDRILTETLDLAEQSLQEVRTLSYLLHPPLLDVVGLGSALRWLGEGFSERSGIRVDTVVGEGIEALSRDAATALFRVAQECLANVHRHSGSHWARIAIHRSENVVCLEVSDGGCGFQPGLTIEPAESGGRVGVGLSGMRIRLEQLQGSLNVDAGPEGTRVEAMVPLAPQ